MKRLLTIQLSIWLMFTQVASANGANPVSAAATSKAASPSLESIKVCEVSLDPKTPVKYRPIGYVSGALLNRFSKQNPFLFTDLYYRVLGQAMFRNGFEKVVNAKGAFLDHISQTERDRVINTLAGTSEENIQRQGRIATEVWNEMVEKFKLFQVVDTSNSVASASKAYYSDVDDYMATRDFLIENLAYKREVIELIRLSMPFGVRKGIDGVSRSTSKTVFLTAAATASTGFLAYAATQIFQMMGTPDPGMMPMIVGAVVSATAGFGTYIYTAPRSLHRKIQLKIMNWSNRRSLAKQGLISKVDGESTIFVKAAFRDLTDLQNEVNLSDIRGVIPMLPAAADERTIESSMMSYGDKLGQQLTSISAFQEMVATEIQKQTRAMGEPISTLGRLFQQKNDGTHYGIPDNARVAIAEYAESVKGAYGRFQEVEDEFAALVEQYTLHNTVLSAYLAQNESRLSTGAKLAIERKLKNMRTGFETASTMMNVAATQRRGFADEKAMLDSALETIAATQGKSSMDSTQSSNLARAMLGLANRVEEAKVNEISDSERISTSQATPEQ